MNNEGIIAQARVNELVYVPPGWTVVGGGGLLGNGTSAVLLCH